jgi:peptide/nickel transport system substrate-binding protein
MTGKLGLGRRSLLQAAASLPLAAPAVAAAPSSRVLKFIPQSDLAVLDPIWTTAYVTRNHGFMVFDTLYGLDAQYKVQPQMLAGANVEADGRRWTLTLRDGLLFHDGTKVLARDCVASIQRWGKRDAFGQALLAATDEISAPDDKTIVFRLKHPFPLLADALGKVGSNICAIMPERLAKTDAFSQVTEMVGSGRATGKPHSPPAARWRISIGSSGRLSPTRRPRRPLCRTARWIGGRTHRQICCRC